MNKTEIDSSVKDMLFNDQTGHIKQPENEAILLQLPGTLPFNEIKPHAKNGLEEILERLSLDEQVPPGYDQNGLIATGVEASGQEPPKIGKLRIMKSGKVVMRIQLPGSDKFADLEINQGIQSNFYQELVSVDAQARKLNMLAQIKHKLVATPDLDSILS